MSADSPLIAARNATESHQIDFSSSKTQESKILPTIASATVRSRGVESRLNAAPHTNCWNRTAHRLLATTGSRVDL